MSTPLGPDPATLPHDSLQPNIIASAVVCWLIAAVFVGLRFYTRASIIHALNLSDWCILASLVGQNHALGFSPGPRADMLKKVFAAGTSAGEIDGWQT